MSKGQRFYEILGLPRDASVEEIRRAYHLAAHHLHPDHNAEGASSEPFLRVQEAYDVLSDPHLRAIYDASHGEAGLEGQTAPGILQTVLLSREALPRIQEPQWVYALVQLSAAGVGGRQEGEERPPVNICLALDRSTSMQGERMDMVKSAAIELLRQLHPEDVLAVVSYADRAEVVLPATRKAELESVINQVHLIHPGGGTEIFRGLEAAFTEVRRHLSTNGASHIFLLTDGRTYGDEQACLELANQAAKMGVGISALGIGEEWNDDFLDELALRTGGDCQYLPGTSGINEILREKYSRLRRAYASQVSLALTPTPGVDLCGVFRTAPEPAPLTPGEQMLLGSLPAGESLDVLLEFAVAPADERAERAFVASGTFTFHLAEAPADALESRLFLSLPFRDSQPQVPVADALRRAAWQVTLYRMQEKARAEISAGQAEKGRRRLNYLAERLKDQGNEPLARMVRAEADQANATQRLSEGSRKRLKYGTRALLLPGGFHGGPG